jgi:hypothetical protein
MRCRDAPWFAVPCSADRSPPIIARLLQLDKPECPRVVVRSDLVLVVGDFPGRPFFKLDPQTPETEG